MIRIESLLSARLFMSPQRVGARLFFVSNLSGRRSLYAMNYGGSVPEPLLPQDIALQNPILMGGKPFYVFPKLETGCLGAARFEPGDYSASSAGKVRASRIVSPISESGARIQRVWSPAMSMETQSSGESQTKRVVEERLRPPKRESP